nr:MAG TPA: hypothetical protein [Caudoviricetes sp.]
MALLINTPNVFKIPALFFKTNRSYCNFQEKEIAKFIPRYFFI